MKKIDLEAFFLKSLGSNQMLKWYLNNNISLIHYLENAHPVDIALADLILALIPKKKINEEAEKINTTRILKLLEKERPDLFKIINTQKGLAWLHNQIINFRARFLN